MFFRPAVVSALLISFGATAIWAQLQPRGYTGPDAGPVATAMQPYLDQHEVSGAVTLIATKDKILDLEAMGYSNLATIQPMKTDDVFWIASMSKAMTAAGLMMLVDAGKVNLDDPVEKYLPEFEGQMVQQGGGDTTTNAAGHVDQNAIVAVGATGKGALVSPAHPITIREAMSHSAGLRFSSTIEGGHLDTAPLKKAVAQYGRDPLVYQPGTEWRYANEGINTAGRIIEVVSGVPYESFLQQRLFTPLGMVDTAFWLTPGQIARLAKSYKTDGAGRMKEIPIEQLTYPLDDHAIRFPMPAGGLFSTAIDVGHFCQMLLNGGTYMGKRYLSETAVQSMTTKETPSRVKNPYGFGLNTSARGFEHGGAYKTDMSVDLQDGLVLVLMVQKADKWPGNESDEIRQIMLHTGERMLNEKPVR